MQQPTKSKKQTLHSDVPLGATDQFERVHTLDEYFKTSKSDETKSEHVLTQIYPSETIYATGVNGALLLNELYHPHPLVMCCSRAYSDHYGLILSPDDIWLLIAQGFSRHVELNSKEMRHLFISDDTLVENEGNRDNEGKINIAIQMEQYITGVSGNVFQRIDWEGVIGEITGKIDSNVKKNVTKLLECEFSTTGSTELVASRVVLMSGFKNYFHYWNMFKCGLPSITLLGSLEDWTRVREKTLELNNYGMEFWTKALIPILDNFIETYSTEDLSPQLIKFWNGIARHFKMSGGKKVDGWINYFFPYNQSGDIKRYLVDFDIEKFSKGEYNVDSCSNFVTGISRVNVDIVNSPIEDVSRLDYLAGFVGYDYDQSLGGLKPRIGWMIAKSSSKDL